ncbi:hypothetical protein ENBRE01_2887 [Enteropsectra breve]|nr:hypothetical protein ENBRE01_2887 [Enteropsectra breve]
MTTRDQHFKKYADIHIKKGKIQIPSDFRIGEQVYIYKKVLGDEFKPRWNFGFTIVNHIPPDAYTVTNGQSTFRVNKKHLKKIFRAFKKRGGDVVAVT